MSGRGNPPPPGQRPLRPPGPPPSVRGRGRARPTLTPPPPGSPAPRGTLLVRPPPPAAVVRPAPPAAAPKRVAFETSTVIGSGGSDSSSSLPSASTIPVAPPKRVLETVPEAPQPERPHDPLGAALGKGGPVEAASRDLKDFSISGKTTTTASDDPELKKPKLYRGTEGKPLNVSANYLRMEQTPGTGVFEYEVRFEPRTDNRDQRFRLLNQHREIFGGVKVFDGVKLYIPQKLEDVVGPLTSTHTDTGEAVQLTLHFKRKCLQNDRNVIQLYNILFGRIMKTLKFTQHNRKYYNAAAANHIKEYNLSVWPGYVTAVDEYESGVLLQLDVSHRVLRTETVRDFLNGLVKKGIKDLKTEAEKGLLGTSVLTRYNNKSYKVDDIDFQASPKSTFTNEKGEELSYMDYYKRQYGLEIRDPNQPLLIHRPKKKALNEEDVEKLICLIPELCLLTGMTDAMRADFRIMKEVSNFTRLNPQKRKEAMKKFVDAVNADPSAKKHLSDWGLKLTPDPISLRGRVLAPEMIFFGSNRRESAGAKGDWNRAATNCPMLTPVALKKWAIFFLNRNQDAAKDFCKMIAQQGPKMGMQVAQPKVVALPNDRTETYLKEIRQVIDPSVQLVLALVPAQKADRYSAIKKLCCMEKPIASQVVCLKTINNPKKLQAVAQKIALQINCKLGGELWACQTPWDGLMVVGIDVFHDKSMKRGSIAGVVSSVNKSLSQYYSTVAIQKSGQEIIDALKVAFTESLLEYHKVNKEWPKDIVIFRDGVSDGQMELVEKHEAEQFMAAISDVAAKTSPSAGGSKEALYKPGFSFIIVQKRINTRLFNVAPNGGFDNPPAGTIVDHTVTRFKFKDFFLIPQSVNQGTVTPTHFVVIKESAALPADAVQKLAYKLTHMYYNWPGTVRVPAPCQYAHKLVDLVGEHLHATPSPELNRKLYYL